MKHKKIFSVLTLCLFVCSVLIAAGLRFGMTGAVKQKVKELDEKVREKKAAAPSLKVIGLDVGKVTSFQAPSFKIIKGGTGATGSLMDSFQPKIEKVELKKQDNSYVTVYSGNGYLEMVGTTADKISGTLNGNMPAPGTYTGTRFTFSDFKIKLKIVSGGQTYYTIAQSVGYNSGNYWAFSTSPSLYDYITIVSTPSNSETTEFPTPLIITGNNDIGIAYALTLNSIVEWEGGSFPDQVTWASAQTIMRALLPSMPSKMIQFDITAPADLPTHPALSNTITLFLNSSGNLLGGYCFRPNDKAINGSTLKSGSLSNVSTDGNSADFDVSFWDGGGIAYFQITGRYNSTSGTYSSLVVTPFGTTTEYGVSIAQTGTVTSK